MKRALFSALLLCLLLAGCGEVAPASMPTLAGLPQPIAPKAGDYDVITVTSGAVWGRGRGMDKKSRWQDFLTAAENGKPDVIIIHCINYGSGIDTEYYSQLRFDGERYWLEDENGTASYSYLLACREDDLPAQEGASHTIHYLLSEHPNMTWKRYFDHALSSQYQPDFPATTVLFSIEGD